MNVVERRGDVVLRRACWLALSGNVEDMCATPATIIVLPAGNMCFVLGLGHRQGCCLHAVRLLYPASAVEDRHEEANRQACNTTTTACLPHCLLCPSTPLLSCTGHDVPFTCLHVPISSSVPAFSSICIACRQCSILCAYLPLLAAF